eukprot:CAMPEP_0202474056 /NCGR_PEP_ID=MMETSP1360-20130828/92178_1 /ASSEMBLY_ACC=CAM_ASM_000848 /TAXON_ID=515479 /ORGANISM="Licmophora paradoxa, Strain CCMP2313" /LENGTH=726 /DNA_ID=CAMNT_0049101153 /DNA_START=63 /DNA_END=2239 /DNA_ORIENTATION=-
MKVVFIALAFGYTVAAFHVAPNALTSRNAVPVKKHGLSASFYQSQGGDSQRRIGSQPIRANGSFQQQGRANGSIQQQGRVNGSIQQQGRVNGSIQQQGRIAGNSQPQGRVNGNYQQAGRANSDYLPSRDNRRRNIIAGNWKLNPPTVEQASDLLGVLSSIIRHHHSSPQSDVEELPEVVVFPPHPYLWRAIHELDGTGVKVGAQNVGLESEGAFTGEVAPSMIRSIGCDYVMLGHSERRILFEETDWDINKKLHLCLREPGLSIVLCVGETLEEYENNLLRSVVDIQLKKALTGILLGDLKRIVIAYEPVWAIGTGKVATPDQAQTAHMAVRQTINDLYGPDAARDIRIQYGGSVKPENIAALMAMPDVDGALVGGASLIADAFSRIVDGGVSALDEPRQRPMPVQGQGNYNPRDASRDYTGSRDARTNLQPAFGQPQTGSGRRSELYSPDRKKRETAMPLGARSPPINGRSDLATPSFNTQASASSSRSNMYSADNTRRDTSTTSFNSRPPPSNGRPDLTSSGRGAATPPLGSQGLGSSMYSSQSPGRDTTSQPFGSQTPGSNSISSQTPGRTTTPSFGSQAPGGTASFGGATSSFGSQTPGATPSFGSQAPAPTPAFGRGGTPSFGSQTPGATPSVGGGTPSFGSQTPGATPAFGRGGGTPSFGSQTPGASPAFGAGGGTPSFGSQTPGSSPAFGAGGGTPSFGSQTSGSSPAFGAGGGTPSFG